MKAPKLLRNKEDQILLGEIKFFIREGLEVARNRNRFWPWYKRKIGYFSEKVFLRIIMFLLVLAILNIILMFVAPKSVTDEINRISGEIMEKHLLILFIIEIGSMFLLPPLIAMILAPRAARRDRSMYQARFEKLKSVYAKGDIENLFAGMKNRKVLVESIEIKVFATGFEHDEVIWFQGAIEKPKLGELIKDWSSEIALQGQINKILEQT